MTALEIREALHSQTYFQEPETYNGSRVFHEFGILNGSCRADIAVANGTLWGFEIKAESDDLQRLGRQIDAYSKVFERVTLVATEKHAAAALRMLPRYWGLIVVAKRRGSCYLRTVRSAKSNPSVDPVSLARLLWRDEALDIIRKRKGDLVGLASKPRKALWQWLADDCSVTELTKIVIGVLKLRQSSNVVGSER
ncbi:MAG TPA: sce7726 family protein [Candidatus Cybelea sp.]|jgi:hypothetical protein|nr:sce7726 family protein [Candidatus Cybelea sp.]